MRRAARSCSTFPAKTDSLGKLKGVPTRLLGIKGDGLRLKANRRYRVTADYDNPTGDVLKQGAMALIVAAFVPDDPAKWPVLDPDDPGMLTDMAMLESIGRPKTAAATTAPDSMHMHHEHHDQ